MTIKTFYKVNNLEFDNLKDAETFDSYLKSFDKKQMLSLYIGSYLINLFQTSLRKALNLTSKKLNALGKL